MGEGKIAERGKTLRQICRKHGVDILYAFGSRAEEVRGWLERGTPYLAPGPKDVDIGVKYAPGACLSAWEKVKLAVELEDLFGVSRVDLIDLAEADPFLAANIIRGERLYARDEYEADEYDLYILRRAGDLAPLEREGMAPILGEER